VILVPRAATAQSTAPPPPVNDEYRITAYPTHPLFGPFTGFGYLGYVDAVDKDVTTYDLGWRVIYKAERARWLEVWSGVIFTWNDVANGSNTHEVRPFVGLKLYVPNGAHVNLYNLTRYEWRRVATDDTGTTDDRERLRSRFGVETPLSARPWDIKTSYLLGDFEMMYRSDEAFMETVRARAGVGYVANHHLHVEFIYHLQLTRQVPSDRLAYTDNIFRLNFKIGTKHGLLRRISGGSDE
jgi:hypothetical protein